MRSPKNNLDRNRGNKGLKVKRKFILAFEGYRTEVQYFNGVSENRSRLRIPTLIEIIPLERYPIESGSSEPDRVLDLLEEYIKFLEYGKYPVDLLINTFITNVVSEKEVQCKKETVNRLSSLLKEQLRSLCDANGLIRDSEEAFDLCRKIYGAMGPVEPLLFDIPAPIDYRNDRDVVCVIVDRDKDSRSISKCEEFFSRCRKNGFVPYMTNPCFEMWLLLHFDEILKEDKKVLLQNDKINGIRFTEKKLDEILRTYPANAGYSKDNLDFGSFMHRVDNAIKNEKTFCNEQKCIKSHVGSNIGVLIEQMRRRD